MKKKYKVSIIIPVYNAENVISKCLESVFSQTEKNIEIICIDDGSTDYTVKIIEEYAQRYNNIVVKKQNHCGAGIARNLGIETATGEYIAFLDADDCYYECDALEKMLEACQIHDTKICGSLLLNNINGEYEDVDIFPNVEIDSITGLLVSFGEYQNDFYYQCFIYSRDIFEDKDIRFPDYLRYQDPPFFLKIMAKYKAFWVMPVHLYLYTSVDSRNKDAKYIDHILMGIEDNIIFAIENDFYDLYRLLVKRLCYYYIDLIPVNSSEYTMERLINIYRRIEASKWNNPFDLVQILLSRLNEYKKKCEFSNILESIIEVYRGHYDLDYVEKLKKANIVVYGVGGVGERIIDCLEYLHINVSFAVDINKCGKKYKGLSICDVNKIEDEDFVIVAMLDAEGVKDSLDRGRTITIKDMLSNLTKGN